MPVRVHINGGARPGFKPTQCSICAHAKRGDAEMLIAGGASVRSVAAKFRMPYHALHRHWRRHVSDATKAMLTIGPCQAKELAAKLADENISVLDHFRMSRASIYAALDAALNAGDRHAIGVLTGRLHENLNSIARITGELSHSPLIQQNVNIAVHPAFASFEATLLRVLAGYPDARLAVIRCFRDMESLPPATPLIEGNADAIASAPAPAA